MPRNGTGTYTEAVADFVSGTLISATDMNMTLDDIAEALTQSLAADGQTPMTGNLVAGSQKIDTVGTPEDRDDGMTLGAFQDGVGIWCSTTGGSDNAYELTPDAAPDAYAAGQWIVFTAPFSNTDEATVAVSGLLSVPIVKGNGRALDPYDIVADGVYILRTDGISAFLLNPSNSTERLYNTSHAATALDFAGGTESAFIADNYSGQIAVLSSTYVAFVVSNATDSIMELVLATVGSTGITVADQVTVNVGVSTRASLVALSSTAVMLVINDQADAWSVQAKVFTVTSGAWTGGAAVASAEIDGGTFTGSHVHSLAALSGTVACFLMQTISTNALRVFKLTWDGLTGLTVSSAASVGTGAAHAVVKLSSTKAAITHSFTTPNNEYVDIVDCSGATPSLSGSALVLHSIGVTTYMASNSAGTAALAVNANATYVIGTSGSAPTLIGSMALTGTRAIATPSGDIVIASASGGAAALYGWTGNWPYLKKAALPLREWYTATEDAFAPLYESKLLVLFTPETANHPELTTGTVYARLFTTE